MDTQVGALPKIRLLADRVLVELLPETEKKIGSIIIPNGAMKDSDQSVRGIVRGISKKVAKNNVEVPDEAIEVGMETIFSKYAGSDISHKNKDYKTMRVTDIFGVDEEDKA